MAVLYRDLLGGYLVPQVTMRPGEGWKGDGQLVASPTLTTHYSLHVAMSSGQTLESFADIELDFSPYDGIAIFDVVSQAQFIGPTRVRFYTVFPTDYFEVSYLPGATPGTEGISGGGLYSQDAYGIARYGFDNTASLTSSSWERTLWRLSDITTVVGDARWDEIIRVEIQSTSRAAGGAEIFYGAITGWSERTLILAEANRMMSLLPTFYWDEPFAQGFLQGAGYELDGLGGLADFGLAQRFLKFAQWGLRVHEVDHGLPVDPTISERIRRATMLADQQQLATLGEITQVLSDIAGHDASVTEHPDSYRVDVVVPATDGEVQARIELVLGRLMPAHLRWNLNFTVPTAPVAVSLAPFLEVAPVIQGEAREGQTISCLSGQWDNDPTDFTYAWYRDGVSLSTPFQIYHLISSDVGHHVSCRVTATNDVGVSIAEASFIEPISALTLAPANLELPQIVGSPVQGSTISSTNGRWTNTPTPIYGYQWQREGVAILGGTSSTYMIEPDDVGKDISVRVRAQNGAGLSYATSPEVRATAPGGSVMIYVEEQLNLHDNTGVQT